MEWSKQHSMPDMNMPSPESHAKIFGRCACWQSLHTEPKNRRLSWTVGRRRYQIVPPLHLITVQQACCKGVALKTAPVHLHERHRTVWMCASSFN
jgi:hypothetical protein